MPATPPNVLLEEGKCYGCLGLSLAQVMILAELSEIASGGCSIPSAPVALNATNASDSGFDANWTAVPGATSYRLDVSDDPGFGSFVAGYNNANVGNATTSSVTGLSPDTDYYYRVRAVNDCGISENSNAITATTNPLGDQLILDDGVNPPTIINNPVGDYDLSGSPWVSVTANSCPSLTGLDLSSAESLSELVIVNCPALVSISLVITALVDADLSGMSSACSSITISSNPNLATIDLSQMTSVSVLNINGSGSLLSINLSSLVTADDIQIYSHDILDSLNFPALTTVTTFLGITSMPSLLGVGLGMVTTFGGDVVIGGLPACSVVDLSALSTFNNLDVSNISGIVSLVLPLGVPMTGTSFKIENNPLLTTFSMNGQPWPDNGQSIIATNSALDEASVDLILAAGVAGGMTSGSIDLSGGTNSPPSAAGAADALILTLSGVVVTTN